MSDMTCTCENTPSDRAPFAADIVVMGKVERERVMVHPATTRTFFCGGVPVLSDVIVVSADGVVDRVSPSWCKAR